MKQIMQIVKLGLLAVITSALLSGCHTLNDKEHNNVINIPNQANKLEQNDMRIEQNVDNLNKAVDAVYKELKEHLKSNDVSIHRVSGGSARVTMQNKVLFKNGSANFSNSGKKVLATFAHSLKENKKLHVRIVGHTDSRKPTERLRKRYLDNWEVSAARAASVARFLTWEQKINPRRLTIVGKADNEPVASNKTAKGRKLNRRVELYLEL